MPHAFKIYTGDDNRSHFLEGSVREDIHCDVVSVHFKETPAHSQLDWHVAPTKQYVITLSGTLEFTMCNDEKFILKPGDVLVATDVVGEGHHWKLIDDQPWRRAYIVLREGADDIFIAKP